MTVADMFTDLDELDFETRLAALEVRAAALERENRRLRADRDHYRRRLACVAAVFAHHNPAHGMRVLQLNVAYVLGDSRERGGRP